METQGFLQSSFRETCFFDTFIFDVADLFLCVHTDMWLRTPPSPASVFLLKLYLFHQYTWGEKEATRKKVKEKH